MSSIKQEVVGRRRIQIERRLNELGSAVKGNQAFQADRICDVLDQVDELRQQLKTLSERVDRMARFMEILRARDEQAQAGNGAGTS